MQCLGFHSVPLSDCNAQFFMHYLCTICGFHETFGHDKAKIGSYLAINLVCIVPSLCNQPLRQQREIGENSKNLLGICTYFVQ